jgi:hypothetical protein
MKALLRSSIIVLVLGAGYAAFSMPSKQSTAGMPGLPPKPPQCLCQDSAR